MNRPYSRRTLLQQMCLGFGGVALQGLMPNSAHATRTGTASNSPLAPKQPHIHARAKRVIFLFMHGGPSHVDLFDYKPRLYKEHNKPLPFKEREVQFANRANIMKPPWDFRRVGASGQWMSELWEHLPGVSDELCVINSVCETNVAHGGACMKIHCGDEAFLRPSMGSWVSYGLGTESENLPGFITICPTTLHGGVNNFGAAFLPSSHQGVPLGAPGYPNTLAKDAKFNYMTNDSLSPRQQKLNWNFCVNCTNGTSQIQQLTKPWRPESSRSNWPFACRRRPRR